MSDENKRFILYMCFETDQEDENCPSLLVHSSRLEIEKWKNSARDADSTDAKSASDSEEMETSTSKEEGEEIPQDPSLELSKLMNRFQETMSSYRLLVGVGIGLMPTLRSHFIYKEMYKSADRNFEEIDKDQQFQTYGITEDQYPSVQTQLRRLREFNEGTTVLPGAILLSLVATFDSFIADTLRIMLRHKSEVVIDSSKTIKVKDVLNMS